MRQNITFFAALALAIGMAASSGQAQDNPKPRTAQITVGRAEAGQHGGARAQGAGCGQDSFGARVCDDGTNFPGGPFGTRPAKKPAVAAVAAPARGASATGAQDPLAVIRGNAAEDGNLYGAPRAGHGPDGYGCRTDANGQVVCD